MLGTEFQDMLRCIRCGACMNHCPVYHAVGGHAYGWVYPGPMGAVLTPALIGVDKAGHLPNASTFCGRCEEVCPMRIPLPQVMRHWREREFERHLQPAPCAGASALWALFAKRPALYRLATALAARVLATRAMARGGFRKVPLAAGWTRVPRLPRAAGQDLPPAVEGAPRMSARDAMLARIRAKVAKEPDEARRAAVAQRIWRSIRATSSRRAASATRRIASASSPR